MAAAAPGSPAKARPSEALLAAIWQHQWLDGGPLIDSSGRELKVVYPGRRWGGPGPDFQGAVIALADGSLLRGDVELHVRSADWRAHRHDRDPAYNQTVLHVVHWSDKRSAGRRADGVELPVLELAGYLAAPVSVLAERISAGAGREQDPPCLQSVDSLTRLVERAGLERFFEKAARFEASLSALEPADVLYRAMLIGLGYSANKRPCELLGELVPWQLVQRITREPNGEPRLRALLLGAAGLLPGQRGRPILAGEAAQLESDWTALAPELGRRPLSTTSWRLSSVRPENTPVRRLVGAAALLVRWAADDVPARLFCSLLEQRERPARLVDLFKARSVDEFWQWHYDFGAPTSLARPWQIGGSRALELVVNVLLPLAYASGRLRDQPELSAAALLAYRALPAGQANRPSRAMALQLFGPDGDRHCRTAAGQQGLLHLFKQFCWERRCEACPAGPSRAGARASGL